MNNSFLRPYSEVWQLILSKNHTGRSALGLSGEIDWVCSQMNGGEIDWVCSRMNGASIVHTPYSICCRVYRLSLAATIYWIWRERNSRLFQGKTLPAPFLGSHIIAEVRACLCSWRGLKRTDENQLLVDVWGLSSRIIRS